MVFDISDMGLERISYPHLTGIPVVLPSTEATADADTFVCEFLGGAAANETGVGGGLTGADLVLTQAGSVGASSGGYRAITSTSMKFAMTAAALQALLNGSEWTIMHRLADLSANGYVMYMEGTASAAASALGFQRNASTYASWYPLGSVKEFPTTYTPPTSGELWQAIWLKNSKVHMGIAANGQPTGWDSFPSAQRHVVTLSTAFGSATWPTFRDIVGAVGSSGTFKIGTVIVSKKGLTAAPV